MACGNRRFLHDLFETSCPRLRLGRKVILNEEHETLAGNKETYQVIRQLEGFGLRAAFNYRKKEHDS